MAAAGSNGKAVDPAKTALNGHAVVARAKQAPKKGGFSFFSVIFRLFCWYSIITLLFRCPASPELLTDTSPRICKPYFEIKAIVAPHVEPYYDTYAAPYVDAAWPYYEAANRSIIAPVTALGKKHGAPRLAQAQAYGQAQWEKTLQPQVQKYQAILQENYDRVLAPHVDTAITATTPYYNLAKTNALQTYYEHLLPAYTTVQPYVLEGYGIASDFTTNTAIPYAQWGWNSGYQFVARTVWPQLRILYGENVEPQLVRIGERLGRYRDGKKIEAVVHDVDSTSTSIEVSSLVSSIASSASSAYSSRTESIAIAASETSTIQSSEAPVQTPLSEAEIRAKAQEIVQRDLKTWQEKFVKAAEEGADELEERIGEIAERLINSQVQGVGKAHLVQLEETVKSNLDGLKSAILAIVESSTGKDDHDAEEKIHAAVRNAGVSIKDKAQAIRTWRQNYEKERKYLVSKAAEDTLTILDHIGDLGMQEIGMRWAWTDGITHKDWAKYHALKPKFDQWRDEVAKIEVDHPAIAAAVAAATEIEEEAMGVAEKAAEELSRLREVARWKLANQDTSEDWSTKILPVIAAAAQDKVESAQAAVSSLVAGAASAVSDAASAVSSIVVGEPEHAAESVASVVSSASQSVSSAADPSSASTATTSTQADLSSVSTASTATTDTQAEASGTVPPVPKPSVEEALSIEVDEEPQSRVEPETSIVSETSSSEPEQASLPVAEVGSASSTEETVPSPLSEPTSDPSKHAASSISSAIASASPVDPAEFSTATPSEIAPTLEEGAKEILSSASSEAEKVATSVSNLSSETSVSDASSTVSPASKDEL